MAEPPRETVQTPYGAMTPMVEIARVNLTGPPGFELLIEIQIEVNVIASIPVFGGGLPPMSTNQKIEHKD